MDPMVGEILLVYKSLTPITLTFITHEMYYGLMGNKSLACGKPTPYYNINHAIKYSNNNLITILVTCHARRNY